MNQLGAIVGEISLPLLRVWTICVSIDKLEVQSMKMIENPTEHLTAFIPVTIAGMC